MLDALPLLQLPEGLVPFPLCDLKLPLLPDARAAVAAALGTNQRLVLQPQGSDVGVVAEIRSITTDPDPEVTYRPIGRYRCSTATALPELEDVDYEDPEVAAILKLAR